MNQVHVCQIVLIHPFLFKREYPVLLHKFEIRCVLLLYHCVRGCEIIGWPAGLIGYHGTQGGPRVSSPIVPSAFPSNLYKCGVFKGHI